MNYILIKINNLLILVSDEELKTGDSFYFNIDGIFDILQVESTFHLNRIKDNKSNKKVLSQSPKLSENVAKKIGWVDVEELSGSATEHYYQNSDNQEYCEYQTFQRGFDVGFQKAQELNQKEYSESDVESIWKYALYSAESHDRNGAKNKARFIEKDVKSFIQSLSKSQWQVEVELMEFIM
jgi:hypothetical protein